MTYATVASALDAIDNMHSNILPGATNGGRVLKVNMAKPSKGLQKGGSNRASESSLPRFRPHLCIVGLGWTDRSFRLFTFQFGRMKLGSKNMDWDQKEKRSWGQQQWLKMLIPHEPTYCMAEEIL